MQYSLRKGKNWLLIYFVLVLIPLVVAVLGTMPEYRNFATELGVALGLIGLGLLGVQFLFSGRISWVAPSFGMDNIVQYHREMGIIAFLFVLAHPLVLIFANSEFIEYFDPRANLARATALWFVSCAMILLFLSSMWRLRFGLSYEIWRLLHGILSLGIIFVGVVHSLQVAHYFNAVWQQVLLVSVFAFFAYLVFHTRIIRPFLSRKKPWMITEVIPERDDCWTIHLSPQGHKGMNFKCGQFVWITLGDSPFSIQQHPFTIVSACNQIDIRLTAKAAGDFTSGWKHIKPGTKAFLEGPFGAFIPVPDKNLFIIMGGIGITPGMSFLRTLQSTGDKRKAVMLYANPGWEEVTFREELDEMKNEINLKLVHVLEKPPEGWAGETGLIDLNLIEKHLPEEPEDFAYYLCGPKPLQDAAELALRDLGIDWRLIHSERFEII